VYLAYLDDSGIRPKDKRFEVISAVVMEDECFASAEFLSSFAAEKLVNLIPEDRRDKFQEFHASQLFYGRGIFAGIDAEERYSAIEYMLSLVSTLEMKIFYGSINLDSHRRDAFGSADPKDVVFRLCVSGIGEWLGGLAVKIIDKGGDGLGSNFALLIVDECDKGIKTQLQDSFRGMRKRLRAPEFDSGELRWLHDDVYFGDSRYSIGIQIADLCSYFIAHHLCKDPRTDHFYKLIEPHIVSGKREE
jgi:hypothetical protein